MGGNESDGLGGGDGVRQRGRREAAPATPLVASVDVGTSLMKCFIFDVDARIVGSYAEPIEILRPDAVRVEIDPESLWSQFKRCFANALRDAKVSPGDITCIGISTQRCTFTTWDSDTGRLFHNFVVWNDQRSTQLTKDWNDSYWLKAYRWLAYGLYLATWQKKFRFASYTKYLNSLVAPRLKYMIDHHPDLAKRIEEKKVKFGCIDTFLIWRLSGGKVHATDYSNISCSGLFDPFAMQYSPPLFFMAGLPEHIFPEVIDNSGKICMTESNILGAAIPVTSVVGDQQASMFGQCAFDVGAIKATFGTGTFLDVNTGVKPYAAMTGIYPLVGWKIGSSVVYIAEGGSNDTGTTLRWATDSGWIDSPESSEAVANQVDETGGVCFVPAFSGIQAPVNDDLACTGLVGITAKTTKPQMVRAMLESLAFRFFQMYNGILEEGSVDPESFSHILIDGGVSNNGLVTQLVADLTGKSLDFPENCDTSAVGAAFLAGLGAGVWTDLKSVRKLRETRHVLHPRDASQREEAQLRYSLWLKAVDRCRTWFQ